MDGQVRARDILRFLRFPLTPVTSSDLESDPPSAPSFLSELTSQFCAHLPGEITKAQLRLHVLKN